MRFRYTFTFALALLAAAPAAFAQPQTRIADKLQHIKLDNGMQIFLYPRKTAPVFCGMLYVDAGSAEENVNETGLAHLLEHMAFKGTPWIGTSDWAKERPILIEIENTGQQLAAEMRKQAPDEGRVKKLRQALDELQEKAAQYIVPNQYDNIITRAGGTEVNASTSVDFTNYFMTLPSNQLELWAMMESQRMIYPSWREFYKERDVVAEERRMRTDDSPMGKLYETFITTCFNAHAYRNPTIGWMSDIQNLTIKATDEFYKSWYVPENFVAVLVGDLDAEQVRTVMNRYFGSIPARKSPPTATTREPEQDGERRAQLRFDAQPQIMIGWHKPTFPDKDMYVFEVIQFLLTRTGRTSRLYERLIKQDGICQEVESFTAPGDKYPNLFAISMSTRAPHTSAEAERVALEEVERIKREPISDAELQKIRNQIDAAFIKELESNLGFARQMGYYYIVSKDPNVLDTMREEMKKVTPQDIMRVAQKYLTKENRTTVELVPSRDSAHKPEPKQGIAIEAAPSDDVTTSTTK